MLGEINWTWPPYWIIVEFFNIYGNWILVWFCLLAQPRIGVGGCGCPIPIRNWRIGMAALALIIDKTMLLMILLRAGHIFVSSKEESPPTRMTHHNALLTPYSVAMQSKNSLHFWIVSSVGLACSVLKRRVLAINVHYGLCHEKKHTNGLCFIFHIVPWLILRLARFDMIVPHLWITFMLLCCNINNTMGLFLNVINSTLGLLYTHILNLHVMAVQSVRRGPRKGRRARLSWSISSIKCH